MHAGLYLHVPFCRTKCRYCDFYSVCRPEAMATWQQGVMTEISRRREEGWGPACDTLYLGGGTPSLLPAELLAPILEQLRQAFTLTPEAEITLEANPDDVTPENLRLWQELGVNRLSLGVQSLAEEELRFLGRRHTAAQAVRALELARRHERLALSVDLIYALPGQGEARWLATLERVLAWQPEHLSCYQLTAAPQTPLGRQVSRGELVLPGEEEQRRLFLATSRFLTDRGYLHYEVSNFAWGEKHCCRHNCKYWLRQPYLGLGPAAHSFDGRRRFWNAASLARYLELLAAGRLPEAGAEVLTEDQAYLEVLSLGLRIREGISLTVLDRFPQGRRLLPELCAAGLLEVRQGRVRPTPTGFVVADGLAAMLLP